VNRPSSRSRTRSHRPRRGVTSADAGPAGNNPGARPVGTITLNATDRLRGQSRSAAARARGTINRDLDATLGAAHEESAWPRATQSDRRDADAGCLHAQREPTGAVLRGLTQQSPEWRGSSRAEVTSHVSADCSRTARVIATGSPPSLARPGNHASTRLAPHSRSVAEGCVALPHCSRVGEPPLSGRTVGRRAGLNLFCSLRALGVSACGAHSAREARATPVAPAPSSRIRRGRRARRANPSGLDSRASPGTVALSAGRRGGRTERERSQ
jgi:hypothetical protein